MRIQLYCLGLLLCCFSCARGPAEPATTTVEKTTPAPEPEYDFAWMLGSWMEADAAPGSETHEYWRKNSDEEYVGLGCTIEKGDTVFKEDLRIIRGAEGWVLEVTGVNEAPTLFSITQQSENSFVSENPENEFPKRIDYRREGAELKAMISDESNKVIFTFQKMTSE